MAGNIRGHIAGLLQTSKRHSRYVGVLALLAVVVAFGVTMGLRRNGRAATVEQTVLDCHAAAGVAHTHNADCYDADGNLVCPLQERELHKHDDSCYTTDTKLVCGQEEHAHSDACYDEEGNLVCGMEEHAHSDACYETTRTLTCGKEEVTEEHVHGPGCFKTVEQKAEKATVEITDDMPAQTFKGELKDKDNKVYLTVNVEAPEGAFPKGTTMTVKAVAANKVEGVVDEAVAKKTDGKVTDIQAVDITFKNKDGKEIEPAKEITVKFASALIADNEEPMVFHVKDDGKAEVMNTLTDAQLEKRDKTARENEVLFDADKFSTYGIAVTSLKTTLDASDGKTYTVTVDAAAAAGIPQGSDLRVSEIMPGGDTYEGYVEKINDKLGTEVGYARMFDISIVKDGQKVQPEQPVQVKIALNDAGEFAEGVSAVHFADEGLEVIDASLSGDEVSFDATGFSVYAVIDGGEGGEARATVNFYGKDTTTPIATYYVKNSDEILGDGTRQDNVSYLEDIVVDPGVGDLADNEIFRGWTMTEDYSTDTQAMDIAEIRRYLADLDIKEGDVVNIYGMVYKFYNVTYIGETEGVSLGTDTITLKTTDTSAPYTVNMAYTVSSGEKDFEGWQVAEGKSNINGYTEGKIYANDTEITISGDVTFSVYAPSGRWLVFHENGGTYVAPQFIKTGETTVEPSIEMRKLGYTFGGWYTDEACTQRFTFGQELTDRTDLYAKWTAAETATYTVIIWKQNINDAKDAADSAKKYDFATSITLSGDVGSQVNTITQPNSNSNVDTGRGNSVRNYSVNGSQIDYPGFHAARYDQDVEITPEGNTVVNVYYDRNLVTMTFKGDDSISVEYKTISGYELALVSEGYSDTYAIKIDGKWYQITSEGEYVWDASSISSVPQPGSGYITYRYGNRTYSDAFVSSNEYTIPDTGDTVFTGLFGSTLSSNGYTWPSDYRWTYGSGTTMTFLDAFKLPNERDTSITFDRHSHNGQQYIYFQKKNASGNGYTTVNTMHVAGGNTTFTITDKYNGYKAVSYSRNNSTWTSLGDKDAQGDYASVSIGNQDLYIRFDPLVYNISFQDGVYVDGRGNKLTGLKPLAQWKEAKDIVFESSVSSYNAGGANYYDPSKDASVSSRVRDGFVFAGWYVDDQCTQPYTFTTMPEGITVYAKWQQVQYRVFMHPNVNSSDTSLNWGSDDVSMSYRVSHGDKVSTPTGTRADYEFIAWYTDSACTKLFDGDAFVLNDTTVTTPYDKTEPTELDKYGNPTSDANKDAQENRYWITKKLDLYAKWRAKLAGANGIGVKYDLNGGTGDVHDNTLYLDQAGAIAQGAPKAPAGQKFLGWVVQKYNPATEQYEDTNEFVYPGDTFTVLKANAKTVILEEDADGKITKATYTVQLRAEYGPEHTPTPTHIEWFYNDGAKTDPLHSDTGLQINEAVAIQPAPTRTGYEFLGWARANEYAEDSEEQIPNIEGLTEDNVYLKYVTEGEDAPYFMAPSGGSWVKVSKVAADEKLPYHALYAVWKPIPYSVSIAKAVNDPSYVDGTTFSFKSTLTGDKTYDIAAGVDPVEIYANATYGTSFTVTEIVDPKYEVTAVYQVKGTDGKWGKAQDLTVTDGTTASIPVTGDILVTYTNSRAVADVTVWKVDEDGNTKLDGAKFQVLTESNEGAKHLENGNWVDVGEDEFGLGKVITVSKDNGFVITNLPAGNYKLVEMAAPAGYNTLTNPVTFNVAITNGVATVTTNSTDAKVSGSAISVKNTPGKALPQTGGPGTALFNILGSAIATAAVLTYLLLSRRTSEGRSWI